MPAAEEEFELILARCRERLSEIKLTVPDLDPVGPRREPARVLLDPPAAARAPEPVRALEGVHPPEPAAPPPAPVPVRVQTPFPAPAPARPAPPPPPTEEHDIFPPPGFMARTPAPAPRPTPRTVPEAERDRSLWWTLGGGAAVLASAATVFFFTRRSGGGELTIALDRSADGLAVPTDGSDLVVAEGAELVKVARDGVAGQRTPLEAPVAAVRWDAGSFWTVDGKTPALIERRDGARPTVFQLNHVPSAIFVRDKYLWTADKAGRGIHQYLITRSIMGVLLQPLDIYALPSMVPESFAIDEAGELWVADEEARRLYRLRAEGGVYSPYAVAPLSPFFGPAGRLRGLTVEKDAVWLMSTPEGGGKSVIRRVPVSRFDWIPAS